MCVCHSHLMVVLFYELTHFNVTLLCGYFIQINSLVFVFNSILKWNYHGNKLFFFVKHLFSAISMIETVVCFWWFHREMFVRLAPEYHRLTELYFNFGFKPLNMDAFNGTEYYSVWLYFNFNLYTNSHPFYVFCERKMNEK